MPLTDDEVEAVSADIGDAAEPTTDLDSGPKRAVEGEAADPAVEAGRKRVSVSLRALVLAAVIVVLVGAVGVLAWLYIGVRGQLAAQARETSNNNHAEEVALDYAVNAANMDFRDLNAWKTKLVSGTSPELKDKLTEAADSMEQILVPLQWNSTAKPLAAKARTDVNGIVVVDAFVNVLTKTMQAPDGLQSTATYSITLDRNNNWQITDVGGIDAALRK
ncbi:hypothetical protein BST36_23535 [Mycolicibacterium moriokaense]|uniref:Mce-associated membrane protein n=1 Tax=Mycolicibacterium moriokaense TaxID=39691 RepID=A0AAD1H8I2_9MYCO|nr:hypothetical protein [Mycolicibacterium moriokaense]MCV7039148.1 hypothetical protein [Mycolicibacterium moriokaense]ORB18564.1 hypothetical protein BST36_23535 [Mycolicibacterium moriokaense]BBX00051.1 hypothetical protein MMOR_09870 [Mycolicibacterium moriokaense]